jgi:hypothetical protein
VLIVANMYSKLTISSLHDTEYLLSDVLVMFKVLHLLFYYEAHTSHSSNGRPFWWNFPGVAQTMSEQVMVAIEPPGRWPVRKPNTKSPNQSLLRKQTNTCVWREIVRSCGLDGNAGRWGSTNSLLSLSIEAPSSGTTCPRWRLCVRVDRGTLARFPRLILSLIDSEGK